MDENKNLEASLRKHLRGGVVMVELPLDGYFQKNLRSINVLQEEGFQGVYISFQRPFSNVMNFMKNHNMRTGSLLFIDVATLFGGEKPSVDPRCVHLSEAIKIDDLVRAIHQSLSKLQDEKKFIFIDSLTTITLYKPLSEIMRLSEFLMRTVKKNSSVLLVLNVAKDLSQKKFIQDIALQVDEVIRLE